MANHKHDYAAELEAAIAAVRAAGAIVRDFYDRAAAATYAKSDGSPVTDADLAADGAIRRTLAAHFPDDPILSEEGDDDARRLQSRRCWIVDPVDGTEQFINRTGEFDVLVALVVDGRPVAVAGLQPTAGLLITATIRGGAWLQRGECEPEAMVFDSALTPLRLATSKWFGAPANEDIVRAIARNIGGPEPLFTGVGFSPRMFLSPRTFDVMVGVRPGSDQTMASEWDFAVADLVFHEAGGVVTDLSGQRLQYNKSSPRNSAGLIAAIDPASHAHVLEAVAAARKNTATSPA